MERSAAGDLGGNVLSFNAVAYVRVSTEEQVRGGVSLDAQEERLRAYCAMTNAHLVALIREEGVSGSVPLAERPGGKQLLSLVRTHKADVVALKLDRLFRDAEDALHTVRAWDKAGAALHLVDMGGQTLNTASAMGRLFLTMTAAFAELERNLTRERTSTALAHKKAHGDVYGPTPFGFERHGDRLLKDVGETEAVHRMKEMRSAGGTYRAIADTLNSQGIRGKRGGKWHASTVRYVLSNSLHVDHRGL